MVKLKWTPNHAGCAIASAKTKLTGFAEIGAMQIDELLSGLGAVKTDNTPKTSTLVPRYLRLSPNWSPLPIAIIDIPRDAGHSRFVKVQA